MLPLTASMKICESSTTSFCLAIGVWSPELDQFEGTIGAMHSMLLGHVRIAA